jgi:hypothetical protein
MFGNRGPGASGAGGGDRFGSRGRPLSLRPASRNAWRRSAMRRRTHSRQYRLCPSGRARLVPKSASGNSRGPPGHVGHSFVWRCMVVPPQKRSVLCEALVRLALRRLATRRDENQTSCKTTHAGHKKGSVLCEATPWLALQSRALPRRANASLCGATKTKTAVTFCPRDHNDRGPGPFAHKRAVTAAKRA